MSVELDSFFNTLSNNQWSYPVRKYVLFIIIKKNFIDIELMSGLRIETMIIISSNELELSGFMFLLSKF